MPQAGKYPIVRGGTATLTRFFDIVRNRPAPAPPVSWKQWLPLHSLTSSYFADCVAFGKFSGLIDGKGPTETWASLRTDGEFGSHLTSALHNGYGTLLNSLGIKEPTNDDRDRLSQAIFATENVGREVARAAADTLVAAFDIALERKSTETTSPGRATLKKGNGGTSRPGSKATDAGAKANGSSQGKEPPPAGESMVERRPLSLAVNLQIILPADASDARYDAILGAVAKHLGSLL